MMMSPGIYLAKRRTAARLSIEDVAGAVSADPALHAHDREDWLKRIESGVAKVTIDVADALRPVFPFNIRILMRLIDLDGRADSGIEAPRLCHVCACSEHDACVGPDNRGCSWAGPDICSACRSPGGEGVAEAAA